MLKTLWLVMVISGGILFLVSLVMIVSFRTFSLIGELTGKTAKKQVARLKKLNVNTSTTGNLVINSETGVEEEIPIKEFSINNIKVEGGKESNSPVNGDGTTYMNQDDSTSYMDVEDKTSYMEDYDETTYMEEVIQSERHSVVLIQEQTSLNL